jgi:hypothetical protein
VPRIHRFAQTVQRLAYVNFFRPEPRDTWPHELQVHAESAAASSAAWSATAYSGFVPYRNPPTR